MKILLLPFCLLVSLIASADVTLTTSNLPIISINTNGVQIPDEPKIAATMGIINNAGGLRNNITDAFNEYNGNIGIEVRGQSSQMFPMKSYSIELRDANGGDNDTPLFGMPEESDWVLYAPYTDKTLMRNFLAYTMSNGLGHWAAHCRYVEVVLNGEYIGIYVFMEKIKRDAGRVNISKLSANDNSGNAVTGGYIFSIDKDPDVWYSNYQPPNTVDKYIRFSYVYPKPADITVPQQMYIQSYVDSFESALAGPDFQDPLTGFRKYADENSFIDYFIVNEVSRNVDGYRISTYLNKNRNSVNSKIIAGPVWDYDIAFRNADYCNGSDLQGWAYQFNYVCADDYWEVPFWWNRMMEDTTFQANLNCRWKQARQGVISNANMNHLIDSINTLTSEAQQRHFAKWPVLGQYVWPNPYPIPADYAGEISALKAWIGSRLQWIDSNLPNMGACNSALPVELMSFSISKVDNDAKLQWQTASENNSDYFSLERSLDAEHFTKIAAVKAAGNSNKILKYQYTDTSIAKLKASKIYYRLRQVDKDGLSKTSNMLALNIKNALFQLQAFPNPVTDNLNLTITTDKEQSAEVTFTNAEGKTILTGKRNVIAGVNHFYYNASAWAKGVYLVKVLLADGKSATGTIVR